MTSPTAEEVSWNVTDDQQYAVDAVERTQERAELVAWEQLDASYDAKRAGEFERRLDQLLSGGAR